MIRSLIVDTSPLIRRVAKAILSDFGLEVLEAAKGYDAIGLIDRYEPRLVILDSALTDMAPLDVLRHIRDAAPKTLHAIYCTSEFDILDLQRAQAAGATDVLVKPFDRATLATKLDVWSSELKVEQRSNYFTRLSRSEIVRV